MINLSMSATVKNLELYKMKFKNELPSRLKCMICENVLINAKQTSCGCKACAKCIENYFDNIEKPCPKCNENKLSIDQDIYQDNATNKEISGLEVFCPLSDCLFVDLLRNISQHVNECKFKECICLKCNEKFLFKDKLKHDESICEMRIIVCKYCKLSLQHKDYKKIHFNINANTLCEKWVTFCPNKCEVRKKVNLKEHLKNCSRKIFDCPFQLINCKAKNMPKKKIKEHLSKQNLNHIQSLLDKIKSIESKTDCFIADLKRHQQLSNELVNIDSKFDKSTAKVMENIQKLKQSIPENLIETVEVVYRNGNLILKVTDFESKKLEAEFEESKLVMSNPFYTNQFGYKLCLKVYPGGFEEGRSSHLSVYSAIMKGDYDDLLSWPFSCQVSFSILDQENGDQHFSRTITPNAEDLHFQKPLEECNENFGFDKFIPLSDIIPASVYYKHDTIYLKISVG